MAVLCAVCPEYVPSGAQAHAHHTKAQKFDVAVISCLAGACLEEHPDVPRELRAVYQLDSQLVCPSVVTGFAVVLTPEVGGEHRVGAAYGADIT